LKINIGSGDERFEGFLNIDSDPLTLPDFCVNIEKENLPFEDNSVEEVIAHHILEHLGEGYFNALQELYRVCKHNAIIDILVPHPRHNHFLNDPTHRRAITPDGLWLFSKKYNDATREQKARASKLGYLYNVDFEVMDILEIPESKYITVFEGKPVIEVEQYMNEHNNIIAETNIKLVVIKEYVE
jgi:SAM-dependent methyltransferase